MCRRVGRAGRFNIGSDDFEVLNFHRFLFLNGSFFSLLIQWEEPSLLHNFHPDS
jgi:hypothetical protein